MEEIESYYKVALKSKRLQEDGNNVPEVLKEKVEKLKNTMPVIQNLSDKCLGAVHWEAIEQVLEFPVDVENPEVTLEKLINMKVDQKKDEIAEIAIRAQKENDLSRQLEHEKIKWRTAELPMTTHSSGAEVYKLGNLDETLQNLDDSLVVINSILANRYVEAIRDQASQFQKELLLIQKTLDEWMTCQKQWAYLESIFNNESM